MTYIPVKSLLLKKQKQMLYSINVTSLFWNFGVERETERERDRDRDRERQRARERDRDRDRERQRVRDTTYVSEQSYFLWEKIYFILIHNIEVTLDSCPPESFVKFIKKMHIKELMFSPF